MPNLMLKTVASPKNVYFSFAWRETNSQRKFFIKELHKKITFVGCIYSSESKSSKFNYFTFHIWLFPILIFKYSFLISSQKKYLILVMTALRNMTIQKASQISRYSWTLSSQMVMNGEPHCGFKCPSFRLLFSCVERLSWWTPVFPIFQINTGNWHL